VMNDLGSQTPPAAKPTNEAGQLAEEPMERRHKRARGHHGASVLNAEPSDHRRDRPGGGEPRDAPAQDGLSLRGRHSGHEPAA
jgi:hypothetical protein